jgi:hypothetical protein
VKKSEWKEKVGCESFAGAEAHVHFATIAAWLKPCPYYKASFDEFFRKM